MSIQDWVIDVELAQVEQPSADLELVGMHERIGLDQVEDRVHHHRDLAAREITILADKSLPYDVLKKVMARPVETGLALFAANEDALEEPAPVLRRQPRQVECRLAARAADRGDTAMELRANLELGQALLRTALGETFSSAGSEVDKPFG